MIGNSVQTLFDKKTENCTFASKMKGKQHKGHYCKICGECKANEKFSGKGHAVHICKACQSLPADVQADMRRIRDVERVIDKFPFSRQDWELLEKYAKKYADKESGQFAQDILESRHRQPQSTEKEVYEKRCLSEFEEEDSADIREWLYEELFEYMLRNDNFPEKKRKQKIIERLNKEIAEIHCVELQIDDAFENIWNDVIVEVKADLESEES